MMDRREFLTTMLQGSLAAALLPNSITPLLIAQYASLHHLGGNPGQQMRIDAVGIGQFGSCCTRLLAYSTHTISCREVPLDPRRATIPDLAELNSSLLHGDLLFLLADVTQLSSEPTLAACCHAAAAAGVQTVMVGPHPPEFETLISAICPPQPFPPHCTVADPRIASQLVALVADLVDTDSFVGIDHGDVKAILRSGNHGIFACKEATGAGRGQLASQQALEELERHGIRATTCRGAMACIYGNPNMTFDDYAQASTVLDEYFPHDISFVFGSIVKEHLADVIKVTILAMH